MKQETNNEMDLLLRRVGRRQDVFAPGTQDHLDADELNAYAENVLPTKTRARYTEHLAECSRCRDLVVRLSPSAGVVVAEQPDKVSALSGWRKFLASLLSPMVLRYAAPALGLIVVAAIGIVVLRRDRAPELVSQVQPAQTETGRTSTQQVEANKQPQSGLLNLDDNTKPAGVAANKEVQTKELQKSPASVPEPTPTPADVIQNEPAAKASAPKPESQPVTVAAEPPAPSPAKLDDISDKRQQNEDAARKQEAEIKVAKDEESKKNFQIDGAAGRGEVVTSSTARSRAAKSKSVVGGLSVAQGAAAPQSGQREGSDRDDSSSSETRSVAGHRFRKQGDVWVDTGYDAPRATMDLKRGSEPYRTLIADEPAIKTIADQLDGEIIVVWKGRAYRIQ
jgi:Sec-independent protein translocase protein TatA